LDLLPYSEMSTDYDQNEAMSLRRLCQILNRVRRYKQVFGADLLGASEEYDHPLSCLTMVILARKILGLGTKRLLRHHARAKQQQLRVCGPHDNYFDDEDRDRLLTSEQLLEILHDHRY
jgi:hypothetical protein